MEREGERERDPFPSGIDPEERKERGRRRRRRLFLLLKVDERKKKSTRKGEERPKILHPRWLERLL